MICLKKYQFLSYHGYNAAAFGFINGLGDSFGAPVGCIGTCFSIST
jgi:hypothetical protein